LTLGSGRKDWPQQAQIIGCIRFLHTKIRIGTDVPADTRAERVSGGRNDYLPFDLLELAFWVSADAATDLTDAGVRGLLNNLAAVEATRAEVCSFVGFLEDIGFSLSVRGKRERRESAPAESRQGWVRQTIASAPDASASVGTQPLGVRIGTGCMRERRRSSIGGRPWPTPHES